MSSFGQYTGPPELGMRVYCNGVTEVPVCRDGIFRNIREALAKQHISAG